MTHTKSNITIKVEFEPGTSIEDAIDEAKSRAIEWNVAYVRFSFNGCRVHVSRNANVLDLAWQYQQSQVGKNRNVDIIG